MRVPSLAAAFVILAGAIAPSAWTQAGRVDDVLERAARYVAQFEQTLSAVVWRERYTLEVRTRRRFGSPRT